MKHISKVISFFFLIAFISSANAIIIDEVKFCSNQPTGQYCENWESSCNEISSANIDDSFYMFTNLFDVVHDGQYDYGLSIDAEDPYGHNYDWDGQYTWKVRAIFDTEPGD